VLFVALPIKVKNSIIFVLIRKAYMNKKLLVIIPLVLLVAAGCSKKDILEQQRAEEKQQASESLTNTNSQEVTVQLDAMSNSGVSGTIVFTGEDGKTKATLLTSSLNGSVSIYSGSCEKPGAVKYSLPAVLNGRVEATLDVAVEDLLNEVPLAVIVQRGKANVACGDISRAEN
jgi:hypothetical protein